MLPLNLKPKKKFWEGTSLPPTPKRIRKTEKIQYSENIFYGQKHLKFFGEPEFCQEISEVQEIGFYALYLHHYNQIRVPSS